MTVRELMDKLMEFDSDLPVLVMDFEFYPIQAKGDVELSETFGFLHNKSVKGVLIE